MIDMTGKEVNIGDFLVDDRGKLFVAQATHATYEREKLIVVAELRKRQAGKRGFMRQKLTLLVSEGQLRTSQDELKGLWRHSYDKYQRPKSKEAIQQRRKKFQEGLRHEVSDEERTS